MVSQENLRARLFLADLVAALTPTDHEPTLEELRDNCERWMTTNVPAPPELRTEPVDADGTPGLWARMPGTSAERTSSICTAAPSWSARRSVGSGSLRSCHERPTPRCWWSTTGLRRKTRIPRPWMTR